MYASNNKNSVKALHASKYNLPNSSIPVDEARERLYNDFGDLVSVHKAF